MILFDLESFPELLLLQEFLFLGKRKTTFSQKLKQDPYKNPIR